jgi:hypothetical protein
VAVIPTVVVLGVITGKEKVCIKNPGDVITYKQLKVGVTVGVLYISPGLAGDGESHSFCVVRGTLLNNRRVESKYNPTSAGVEASVPTSRLVSTLLNDRRVESKYNLFPKAIGVADVPNSSLVSSFCIVTI